MLISHRKKFIFTKTLKTAGTSIESYFERYCMPEGDWFESHARDEYVSEAGIIGYRGDDQANAKWYNHMSVDLIRAQIEPDLWDSYFKFTVVRNPFDKLISAFFMYDKNRRNLSAYQKLRTGLKRLIGRSTPIERVTGKNDIERFRSWIGHGGEIIDRDKYLIDGREVVDFFVRFEELHKDLEFLCNKLKIPFEPSRLPTFKKGIRHHNYDIAEYYDQKTYNIVASKYRWEIARFGYTLPDT